MNHRRGGIQGTLPQILDEVDEDGILITKRGKPVAKLVPVEKPKPNVREFFGIFPDLIVKSGR